MAADAALEARIDSLLQRMSLEDKVGQVVQGDLDSLSPADLQLYRLGSVLAGGNSEPGKRYNASAKEWLDLADALYQASVNRNDGGPVIPVLLGIDAVHGHNNVVGATLFPHNIGLGAINDAELVGRIAAATAEELRSTGFEWTFAPTVTVPRDDRWGRTYEGYSEDGALVARYATAVVQGLQGSIGDDGFLDQKHVIASSKHFIGDGGTFEGHDKGDTRVSEAELRDIHGAGHIAALQAGTQTVMASFSSWNGQKMHGNYSLLTEVLKQRLGFDGFVVGDWNGHGEVKGCSNQSCAASFNAGVDMFMAPDSWRDVYDNTLSQVRSGAIAIARLDDAVRRILRVKLRLGLFEAGAPSSRALGGKFDLLGSDKNRALAREAVRRSLVLLKNNGGLLPVSPRQRVLVAGDGADNIGKQSGGWTLTWQGTGTKTEDFPNAESIWQGIRSAVKAAGGEAELSVEGRYEQRPDVAVVVFGEDPYAEFIGDVPHLGYQLDAPKDLQLLRSLKSAGIPVVAVFLSGRPMWVNPHLNASNAFVAAWLPGSEGGGIADVLFSDGDGKPRYAFEGRLPFSWPRSAAQSPLNAGQDDYDPLFPLGFGLSYGQTADLPELSELPGVSAAASQSGLFFARGAEADGLRWWLANSEGESLAVAQLPSLDLVAGVRMLATDHTAQEDARRFVFRSQGGSAELRSTTAIALSALSKESPFLVVTLKVSEAPQGALRVGIGQQTIDISAELRGFKPNEWLSIAVPVHCPATAPIVDDVTTVFHIQSSGATDLALSRIALGVGADRVVKCPSAP
ncbi:glycoside hydrolase family 3 C-terminal domain-containing protein [Pseudoxanthomonas sp. CAU 1598]|uniref:Glycoside hydrolase family 3 C-terminal domain-containing protein n=1 Tax=Pseudomarimonas arenosa TaxID=2774145 RepID=A0AAW3ZNR0_9GAMM|nr:glycoside hydrolase family 3 C-terminal domain-containing protein [Pseudomarimonas arenosa]